MWGQMIPVWEDGHGCNLRDAMDTSSELLWHTNHASQWILNLVLFGNNIAGIWIPRDGDRKSPPSFQDGFVGCSVQLEARGQATGSVH